MSVLVCSSMALDFGVLSGRLRAGVQDSAKVPVVVLSYEVMLVPDEGLLDFVVAVVVAVAVVAVVSVVRCTGCTCAR